MREGNARDREPDLSRHDRIALCPDRGDEILDERLVQVRMRRVPLFAGAGGRDDPQASCVEDVDVRGALSPEDLERVPGAVMLALDEWPSGPVPRRGRSQWTARAW